MWHLALGHLAFGVCDNGLYIVSRAQHNFEPTSTLCTAYTAECSHTQAERHTSRVHTHRKMRLLLLLVAASVHAVKERATGFDFPRKNKLGALRGLGVRTKGPIKVYAVGRYDKGFLLKMKMGVGAEKMSNALVDAVKPRCSDNAAVDQFKELMVSGLPDGCKKGMELGFDTSGGKLGLTVNGRGRGSVSSRKLCGAFEGVYTDSKAVCKLNAVEDE